MLTRFRWFVLAVSIVACRKEAAPPTPPTQQRSGPIHQDQVARGAYVAALGGCVVCHTPMKAGGFDSQRAFAGGLEVKELGGVWRSPNITPDRDTGIGAWTDEQVIAAIRTGVRPGGGKLLPIMPYPYYHRMTDADARAVVAFLRALPPIANQVGRSTGLAMQAVDLPPATGNIDPVGDPKAHGEYIASLMHCGACHTPQDGPHRLETFAGGTPLTPPGGRTILSANITSDPVTGIGKWSEQQIIDAVRTMKHPDGHSIEGPMAFYADAWSKLGEADARALAVYVKSVPPVRNQVEQQHAVTRRP